MPPFPRLLLSVCISLACAEGFAADTTLLLRATGQLAPIAGKARQAPGPTQVDADRLEGVVDREVTAQGQVIFTRPGERAEADWAHYLQASDTIEARGNVLLQLEQNQFAGDALKLNLSSRLGEFTRARYAVPTKSGFTAQGRTSVLHFEGQDHYRLEQASYTTCPVDDPDWQLKSDELKLDYLTSIGTARHVRVEYFDIPILYTPWMDFSLDDRRKSGFLTPTYGASDTRGAELSTPWYWNLAPNHDLTFTPRIMTKRGVQLGTEFRYLERPYAGNLEVEWLPQDRDAGRDRYLGAWRHSQRLGQNWIWNVNLEAVSDDLYFRDLSGTSTLTSKILLPRQTELLYNGGWWNAAGRLQGYQVLQDPAAPIVEPYRRLPQLTLNASRDLVAGSGLHLDLSSEYVRFAHPGTAYVQGDRAYAYPSLSWPVRTAYATVTPKLGVHLARYQLDDASATQDSLVTTGNFAGGTRSLPIASLDAGLMMERNWSFLGQNYLQTLEPRAYYLYIPYRDQSRLPVYDSGLADLSLVQLFSENQFIGVDRINDANQFTLALTSRFIEDETGVERLQATLGQRYHLANQRVTLPGQAARDSNTTDIVALVSGQLNQHLSLNSGFQFNTDAGTLAKANLGGTWREGPGKLVNLDYRYISNAAGANTGLNQIDLSAQWPLSPKWYGLGRLNYSLKDSRIVEGLAGFEYNAGCWSLRGVMQRLVTTENTASSAFYLQLEMRGLTKLGPNPLDVLKRSISGYAKSDDILDPTLR